MSASNAFVIAVIVVVVVVVSLFDNDYKWLKFHKTIECSQISATEQIN